MSTTATPVTSDEVLAVLLASKVPLVAKGVADRIWKRRGTNTVWLTNNHVKPVLEALIGDHLVETQPGDKVRDALHLRGANRTATFYSLTDKGLAAAEAAAYGAHARANAVALAEQLAMAHGHRFVQVAPMADGNVQLTVTPEQATALTSAPHDRTHEQAMQDLVDVYFGGDWTRALLAIGRAGQIAVAYLDRRWFTDYLKERGVEMTDDLWLRVADNLDDFDEFVGDAGWDTDYASAVLDRANADDRTTEREQ